VGSVMSLMRYVMFTLCVVYVACHVYLSQDDKYEVETVVLEKVCLLQN